jgi:hypothetical protein
VPLPLQASISASLLTSDGEVAGEQVIQSDQLAGVAVFNDAARGVEQDVRSGSAFDGGGQCFRSALEVDGHKLQGDLGVRGGEGVDHLLFIGAVGAEGGKRPPGEGSSPG